MSMDVDNRIVQMQFRNAEFEKGIKESSKSLENFKKLLKFEGAEEGFEKLAKVSNTLALDKIASGIDQLTNRFSLFGTIAYNWAERIADKALSSIKSMGSMLSVGQIEPGFKKYNEYTTSVQTIIAATGKSMDYVSEQMDKLMWFTDETSYNFVDMTSNIGKFTSMGVGLKTAVGAMQGIANWAAISGQNASTASRVMYNMSQAIGVGSVKLMDWRSVENANMATKEFKETVIETAKELGVLDKNGKIVGTNAVVTAQNFNENLAKGWFNKDVLLKTLGKYNSYTEEIYKIAQEKGISASEAMHLYSGELGTIGERAFKAAQEAKTFEDAIDSVKDAVSTSWLKTFEHIFGNYEEAKVLWTDLANNMWEIFAGGGAARNELLKEWKELGGRDGLVAGFNAAMETLVSLVNDFREAWAAVFPVTAKDLKNVSDKIQELGERFRDTFAVGTEEKTITKEIKELVPALGKFNGELKEGSTGDAVKSLQQMLINLGYAADVGIADGVYGPNTKKAIEHLQRDCGVSANGVYDEVTHLLMSGKFYGNALKEVTRTEEVTEEIETASSKLIFLRQVLDGALNAVKLIGKVLGWLGQMGLQVVSIFSPIGKIFYKVFDYTSRLFQALGERSGKLIGGFKGAMGSLDYFMMQFKRGIAPLREGISKLVDSFLNLLGLNKDWGKMSEIFYSGWNLKYFQKKANDFYIWIDKHIHKLVETAWSVSKWVVKFRKSIIRSKVIDKLALSFRTFGKTLGKVLSPVKSFGKAFGSTFIERFGKFMKSLPDRIIKLTIAAGEFIAKVVNKLSVWISKIPSAKKRIMEFFSTLFGNGKAKISKSAKTAFGLNKVFDFFASIPDRIKEFVKKIPKAFKELRKKLERFADDTGISNFIRKVQWVYRVVRNFLGILFEHLGGIFHKFIHMDTSDEDTLLGKIKKRFSVFDGLGPWLKRWFSIFMEKLGVTEKFEKVKKWLSDTWSDVTKFVGDFFGRISKAITGFFTVDTSEDETLGDKLKHRFSFLEEFGKWFKENVFPKFQGAFEWIKEKIAGLFSEGGPLAFIGNLFKSDGDKKGPLSGIGESVKGTFGNIGDIFGKVFEFIQKHWKTGAWIAAIYVIIRLLLNTTGIILKLKGVLERFKKKAQPLSKSILQVAEAIGIIAACVAVLSFIPEEGLSRGMGIVSTIFVALGILIGAATQFNKTDIQAVEKIGEAIKGIGFGIASIAGAIAIFGLLPTSVLEKGSAFMLIWLVIMGIFMFVMNKLNATNLNIELKGMLELAGAIAILGVLAWLLGKVKDQEQLWRGIEAVLALTAILGGFIIAVNKLIPNRRIEFKGLIPLAICVAILGIVAWALGKMKLIDLIKGVGAVVALMGTIIGLYAVIGHFGNNYDAKSLWALFIGVALIIGVFGFFASRLGGVDPWTIAAFGGSIVLILAAVAGISWLIGKFSPNGEFEKGAKALGVALLALAGGVIVIVGGLGALDILTEGKVQEAAERGVKILQTMFEIFNPKKSSFALVAIVWMFLSGLVGWIEKKIGDPNPLKSNMVRGATSLAIAIGILVTMTTTILGGLGELDILTEGELSNAIDAGIPILNKMLEIYDPKKSDFTVVAIAWATLSEIVGKIEKKIGDPNPLKSNMVSGATSLAIAIEILATMTSTIIGGLGYLDVLTDGDIQDAVDVGIPILNKMLEIYDPEKSSFLLVGGAWIFASTVVGVINKKIGDPNPMKTTMVKGAVSLAATIGILASMTSTIVGGLGYLDVLTDGDIQDAVDVGLPLLNKMLEIYDPEKSNFLVIASAWTVLSTIIGSINEARKNAGKSGLAMIKGAGSIAGAIGVLAIASTAIVGGLGELKQLTENSKYDFGTAVTEGAEILKQIADAFASLDDRFVAAFSILMGIGGIVGITKTEGQVFLGVVTIGAAVDALIALLGGLVAGMGWIEEKTKGKFTKYLEDGGTALYDIGHAMSMFISGIKDGFSDKPDEQVTKDIESFGNAFNSFYGAVEGLSGNETFDADTDAALSQAQKLHEFFSGLEGYDLVINDAFESYVTASSQLSTDMELFASAIGSYRDNVVGFSEETTIEEDTEAAIGQAKVVKGFFDGLAKEDPEETYLTNYTKKIDDLLDDVAKFGTTMGSYATNIKVVGTYNVPAVTQTAMDAASMITEFLKKLEVENQNIEKHKSGIFAWFEGETTIDAVLGYVEQFGTKIGGAVGSLAGIGAEGSTTLNDMNTAVTVVDTFMRLLIDLYGMKDENGGTVLDNFRAWEGRIGTWSNLFEDLADGFNTFADTVNYKHDYNQTVEGIKAMADILSALSSLVSADHSLQYVLLGLDGEKVGEKLDGFINGILVHLNTSSEIMQTHLDAFKTAGEAFVGKIKEPFENDDYRWVSSYVSTTAGEMSIYKGYFTLTGINFVDGLIDGLNDELSLRSLYNRVWQIGQDMLSTLDYSLDEHSPSEETKKRGSYFTEGLAIGISEAGSAATKATENVAGSVLTTAENNLTGLSNLLAMDIEEQPVIRPIVDLTDVRLAVGNISAMFEKEFVMGYSASMVSRIGGKPDGQPIVIQNDSSSVVAAINDMNTRIDNLGESIRSLQMVVDSGALVGHIAPLMDKELGRMAYMKGRMG